MIGGTLLTYWLLKRVNRIDKEKLDSYRQWCWQTITLIITLLVLTLVIKYSMPRYRFRAINLLNESVLFTPIFVVDPKWYEFYHDYPIDWIQSFPSGHVLTNMGCLMLLTLPGISVQRQRKINLYVLLYLLLIGWMRIENGAHFLTDVCFAYLLGIGTWAISQWLVKRRNVHHRRTHQLMD
jgi:membrane-associated phospholipid phosphatase